MTNSYGVFFFFQAEDGIRDLVRSRGLGDVYKRQALERADHHCTPAGYDHIRSGRLLDEQMTAVRVDPGSYTHLTLPTSGLV